MGGNSLAAITTHGVFISMKNEFIEFLASILEEEFTLSVKRTATGYTFTHGERCAQMSAPRRDASEHKAILLYLNQVAGKKFKPTDANMRNINARLKEGYTIADFKAVVDLKWQQWSGSKWESFMRPQTLFGTKMDSYLNEVGPRSEPKDIRSVIDDVFEGAMNGNKAT